MSITNRNSNTSTTGLYRGKYNNSLSTGSGLRSLSATLQPRSVGTRIGYLLQKFGENVDVNSWNSVRWNKTQPTDAYKGHSSRLSKAFEPTISTTILPFNSYSLSPAIKRNLGTKTSSSSLTTAKTNNYTDTNSLKSTFKFDIRSTNEKIDNKMNNSTHSNSYQTNKLSVPYLNGNNIRASSTNNSTIFDTTKRNVSNLYSSPSTNYLGRSSIYKDSGNSMAITTAMSNLGSQHSTSKNERPWRQRLADSARLRNLEGTGEIASKVSSKYMIQRAAKRDSLTSGDEMSIGIRQYRSVLDKKSISPPYLSSNMKIPYSMEKSTSGISNNFQDDNDSGVMSKSVTSRSSWNNSIISNKSLISQSEKIISQMANSTDNSINKSTDIKIEIRKTKHMDDIKESDIKIINNKKSIKERTERRNSRKNLLSQSSIENKSKKRDTSTSASSSSSEESKDKMKENRNVLNKKKRKLRKKDSLTNIEIKKEINHDTLINSTLTEKPVIIKKVVKQPSITEFPPSTSITIIPPSTPLEITNEENKMIINKTSNNMKENKKVDGMKKELNHCAPNTEYIKRTPVKKFVQTTADKPKVINENMKISNIDKKNTINGDGKESSDESKYNDIVHFKLPSRIPTAIVNKKQLLKNKSKKIPPIPGIYVTDDNEINISINKHFKAPKPKLSESEEASKTIYTKSIKNVCEKVVQTFKEVKRKKKKILVIRASFDLKKEVKEQFELLNYTFFEKNLKNKESLKKTVQVPKKPVENISVEKLLVKNTVRNNCKKAGIIKKYKSIEREKFSCKCVSFKERKLNLDVIKKSEEKVANVTVMTSNIRDINFNSISKEIELYSPIRSIGSLTPKAMTEEPLSVDVSLTLPVKCLEKTKRASAPPESSHRRRNKIIETRASIVLKKLRLEDPAIYDTQPTIIPEYSQKYIHLKADPNYIPGDPIILPDSSILEEYVRRKRGNLEKYIHEPIIEENSSLSSYSNNTLSHCDSPSIASTISEYHPPLPIKIIEPNFAHTSKIKPFKNISKSHFTTSENNNHYNMIDMVNFNLNKPKFVTNNKNNDSEKDNFLNLIRRPLRSREHTSSTNINKVFDKPHSAFEERMQNQAKAVVLKRTNPSLTNSFLGSNPKTNELMNTSFDVTWSSSDTLNDKKRLSADNSNQNLSTHLNHNNPMTSNNAPLKQTLAQSFAQAAAAASQPRHERYAAHLPVSNCSQVNKESNGRQSTTSIDSNNSLVLEKASTQVEQMIDNAKFKHQQSRNKFKDAIEYLDQIFEDFKKDTNSDENKKRNSIGKGINSFPTTGYGGQNGPNEFTLLNNSNRKTIDPIKNVTLYHTSNGQVSSNNSSRKHSYSQNNSLIEDNVVEVSETVKLPPTNKKLSSDKLDFTQKWLFNDVKLWAHSQKTEPFTNHEPVNFDCDEGSVGSCSAEVAAINSKERERKRIGNVKNEKDNVKKQIPNNYLIKPHPYRPQPFPLEGAMIKKIPSIEQIQGNMYQPTGSQFFKPPSMVSLNELSINRSNNRAQSQEYQGNNNDYSSGMYMKINDNKDDRNKSLKNFGSIQSLPDAGMLRNQNGGSLKIIRKKDDAMKAIDALVAELEMNVNDENTKRRSFPLNGGNNGNKYAQINKEYERSISKDLPKPVSTSNTLTKTNKKSDSHQLDEMANLLTTVVSDIGNVHPRRGTFNNHQVYESSIKGSHNPFEKINNERIGSSRVEAMHNIFENKGLQPDSHYNSGVNNHFNQNNYQKSFSNSWNRNSFNQKNTKPTSQNLVEEDNYYEVADFDINNLKQKAPSKVSLNSTTYPEYIPSYPSSQPPSCPPPSSSINSLNHGFYSSTNSSSATIPTQNTNSLHKKIKNQPLSIESANQVILSKQPSIVERHSLLSQNQNTINNDEDDDGFYDNINSNIDDDRRFSRDNETLDNLSISSTKYSTAPRNGGNKLSNLLRKFSIGSNTNVKPSSTGSFISLNKMSLNEPINVNNKRNNLMKSNSLSMEPWEKQVLQGQSSGRRSPGNVSQTSKKNSLGSRIKNSIFGSKKSLKNIY